jgi:hypothetical protein
MLPCRRRNPVLFAAFLLLAGLFSGSFGLRDTPPGAVSAAALAVVKCPPLPPPAGPVVEVASEAALVTAVNQSPPGTTILIRDGTYHLGQNGQYLWLDTPNVTLRSKSGNREAVVLDDDYAGSEVVSVAASNVTIADLTIRRARTHAIHVTATDSADTLDTLIYNVHVVDPGQQGIKINPNGVRTHFTDGGEVACSHIELTDAGRPRIWEFNGSCYTGGIDGHWSRGWEIRDNRIEGFWCPDGLSEHAVHFWTGSRDTLIERNQLLDNARGIGFGLSHGGSCRTYADNPCPQANGHVDHYRGMIRSNFIYAGDAELLASASGFDCGICLEYACGVDILHNTVVSLQTPFSSIEWRFSTTSAVITNNLVSHNLRPRDGAAAVQAGNLSGAPLSMFTGAASGNLHLFPGATTAIDKGVPVPGGLAGDDIDGGSRPFGAGADIGADEFGSPPTIDLFLPLAIR